MRTSIFLTFCFNLIFCTIQAQNIQPDTTKSIKSFTGSLEEENYTQTTRNESGTTIHKSWGIKLNTDEVKYKLRFEQKSRFVNMGRDGNGSYNACVFYKGTYLVCGTIDKQTITVTSIECLKKSDQPLKVQLMSGIFATTNP